jgi:hypothetical protein
MFMHVRRLFCVVNVDQSKDSGMVAHMHSTWQPENTAAAVCVPADSEHDQTYSFGSGRSEATQNLQLLGPAYPACSCRSQRTSESVRRTSVSLSCCC